MNKYTKKDYKEWKRLKKKMSYTELSHATGVHRSYLQRVIAESPTSKEKRLASGRKYSNSPVRRNKQKISRLKDQIKACKAKLESLKQSLKTVYVL